MTRTTACIAIEREFADLARNKFDDLRRTGKYRPCINSKMHELETMGDILSKNTNPDLLSLLHPDLRRAPASPFKGSRHQQNLPRSGMRRRAKKMRVQQGHGQNHDNQQDDDPGQKFSRFHSLVSLASKKRKKKNAHGRREETERQEGS